MHIDVKFSVEIYEEATEAQILEWLRFNLGNIGGISMDNPLCDEEIEARSVQVD